jgi:hypothetical protein
MSEQEVDRDERILPLAARLRRGHFNLFLKKKGVRWPSNPDNPYATRLPKEKRSRRPMGGGAIFMSWPPRLSTPKTCRWMTKRGPKTALSSRSGGRQTQSMIRQSKPSPGALALGSPKTTHDAALFRVHFRRRGRAADHVALARSAYRERTVPLQFFYAPVRGPSYVLISGGKAEVMKPLDRLLEQSFQPAYQLAQVLIELHGTTLAGNADRLGG